MYLLISFCWQISQHLRLFSSDDGCNQNDYSRDLALFYILYTLKLVAIYVLVLSLKKHFSGEWMYPNQSSSVYIVSDIDDSDNESDCENNDGENDGYEETVDFAHKWTIVGYNRVVKEYIDSETFFHVDYPESTFFLRLYPRKRYTSLFLHFTSTDLEKVSVWLTCSVVRLGKLQKKFIFENSKFMITL